MKKQNIKKTFDETNELLTELAVVSTEHGFHLDNDLEGGLFGLLLDGNEREMKLLYKRVEYAINQIKAGTFILKEAKQILHINKKIA